MVNRIRKQKNTTTLYFIYIYINTSKGGFLALTKPQLLAQRFPEMNFLNAWSCLVVFLDVIFFILFFDMEWKALGDYLFLRWFSSYKVKVGRYLPVIQMELNSSTFFAVC